MPIFLYPSTINRIFDVESAEFSTVNASLNDVECFQFGLKTHSYQSPPSNTLQYLITRWLWRYISCVSRNSSSTFWWTSLFDAKCCKIQAICTVCAKSTCQFHTMCFNTVTTDASLHLGPIKLWRHVNDCIYMKIWVPLFGKTTQVLFVAECDCGVFAGMENSTYVCRCNYVAVSCGAVLIFSSSSFGMWLCFVIDLSQFFAFKMQFVRPDGSRYCTCYTMFHTFVQPHRNCWLNNCSVDATCCYDLHLWGYPRHLLS